MTETIPSKKQNGLPAGWCVYSLADFQVSLERASSVLNEQLRAEIS
jgi:hypothetical protein